MTLRTPTTTRTLPVRLCDIPLNVRAHAAQQVAKTADPDTRADLLAAALAPSEETYYVHDSAAPMLAMWKAA